MLTHIEQAQSPLQREVIMQIDENDNIIEAKQSYTHSNRNNRVFSFVILMFREVRINVEDE